MCILSGKRRRPSERSSALEIPLVLPYKEGQRMLGRLRAALRGQERRGPGWCYPQWVFRHLAEKRRVAHDFQASAYQ